MRTEAERYKFILEKSGLSKSAFAASIGISRSHSYHLERGTQKPPREVLEQLAALYNVNLNWLIHGKGPSGLENDTVEIKLLEQEAAAGHGVDVPDYTEKQYFQIPRSLIGSHHPDRLLAVHVAGDSMIGEHINDGDIVIFHPEIKEGNGIYVVSIGNSLVVKRVDFNTPEAIILISANPSYEPRRFSGMELGDIRVAGRVVACYHKV
ncbi:helix-turn-helix domain-containing protein [Treponema primitia]|uniref:LexA family transcriptional regulator n=1 Tax=Treponema primitia TaxID=88058 RepID=UPI0039801EE7